MIVLHKLDGQEVLLDAREIREAERQGSATILRVGREGRYVVTESPEDIQLLIQEEERSLHPEVPSPPKPGTPAE